MSDRLKAVPPEVILEGQNLPPELIKLLRQVDGTTAAKLLGAYQANCWRIASCEQPCFKGNEPGYLHLGLLNVVPGVEVSNVLSSKNPVIGLCVRPDRPSPRVPVQQACLPYAESLGLNLKAEIPLPPKNNDR